MSNKKHATKKKKNNNTKSKISSRGKKTLCTVSSSSSRKSRTKTKKPKFLSLRKQIINPQTDEIITRTRCKTTTISSKTETMEERHHHLQLNLFPLHPDNITNVHNNNNNHNTVDPVHACDDVQEDNNMALFLLNSETPATLNGLLSNDSEAAAKDRPSGDDESDLLTPSSMSNYKVDVRSAMKRSSSGSCSDEEKWVWYTHDDHEHGHAHNLAEDKKSRRKKKSKKKVEEEVTSSTCGSGFVESDKVGLLLKLENFQEILNAWSDKGSVLIGHGSVSHDSNSEDQTVPDLNFFSQSDRAAAAKNLMDGWGNGSVWRVPEKVENEMMSHLEEIKDGTEKTRQREASVLRYKEKRQNRLFAKRIRYEVRKVNAEKRPRIKGRFVRRNCEELLP